VIHMLIAATTTATTSSQASSGSRYIFPILLVGLAVMWLVFIRPQRRKQRAQQGMQSDLAVGDEVLTAGGVYGTVTRIGDDDVSVEIAPNVEIRLARRAIAAQLTDHASAETDTTAEPESGEDNPG
jgi:preprotein translocase subunit YajC